MASGPLTRYFQAGRLGRVISQSEFPHLRKGDHGTRKITMTALAALTLAPGPALAPDNECHPLTVLM